MLRVMCFFMAVMVWGSALADVADVHGFETRSDEQRYQSLTSELRCPKCQNQNIADSNSPISKDMRNEVYRMMQNGASNDDIINALVGRFGEFVRYKPKLDSRTILLWATPAIAILGGLLVVVAVVVRSRRAGITAPALSDEEQAKIDRILAERNQDSEH